MGLTKEEKDQRKQQRKLDKWNQQHKLIEGLDHKICNKCNEWFPANIVYFYPNKTNGIDGLNPYCVECAKTKADEWQRKPENYDKVMFNVKNQNAKEVNKINKREFSKKQRTSGYIKDYYYENPDKYRVYGQDRRNKKKHKISEKEWDSCRLYFNYCCAYCSMTYEDHYKIHKQDLHKEHVDDEGANDLSNCVPSCRNCNSQKWVYDVDDWYNSFRSV